MEHSAFFHLGFFLGSIFIFAFLISFVGQIVFYVLSSVGLYRLAKNRNLENAYIAWIPYFKRYLIGELTGNQMWGESGSKWILAFGPLVLAALTLTGIGAFAAFPLGIAYIVYYFMCLYKLFKIYKPQSAELYIITSVIFMFMGSIWIFVIRNNEPDYLAIEQKPENHSSFYGEEVNETKEESLPDTDYVAYASVREKLEELKQNGSERDTKLNQMDQKVNDINFDFMNLTRDDYNFESDKEFEEVEEDIELTLDPEIDLENTNKDNED